MEIPSDKFSNIIDALNIHSNILKFSSNDENATLELVFGPRITTSTIKQTDPSKLKGHALLSHTMYKCLPSILLQIYSNPCLYWLHQPAFYVLTQRLNIAKDDVIVEVQRMKDIFVNEFITRKTEDVGEMIAIWERIDFAGNDELSNILLTSIVPFVFCYFNVVEVIKNQVRVN